MLLQYRSTQLLCCFVKLDWGLNFLTHLIIHFIFFHLEKYVFSSMTSSDFFVGLVMIDMPTKFHLAQFKSFEGLNC